MPRPEPPVLWEGTLDDRYLVRVTRAGPRAGLLTVHDGDRERHREHVTLSDGAAFGPHPMDVGAWQDRACEVVDALRPALDKETP